MELDYGSKDQEKQKLHLIVYKYHFSSFEELLSKEKSVKFHQRTLQILATEILTLSCIIL